MKMWDIANRINILEGQRLVIKENYHNIAEYKTSTEVRNARYQDVMQKTAGCMIFSDSQIILYVK